MKAPMKSRIPISRVEGKASRQAHADLPEGTYEREVSKEGFFGPAAFFYHRRRPTGWSPFEGPLLPQAFDLTGPDASSPPRFGAPVVLQNGAVEMRFWKHAASP